MLADVWQVDPKFANPAKGSDFHLQPGSPAIDQGAAVEQVTDDFDRHKRPTGQGFDLGPFEFAGKASSAGEVRLRRARRIEASASAVKADGGWSKTEGGAALTAARNGNSFTVGFTGNRLILAAWQPFKGPPSWLRVTHGSASF